MYDRFKENQKIGFKTIIPFKNFILEFIFTNLAKQNPQVQSLAVKILREICKEAEENEKEFIKTIEKLAFRNA